MIPPLKLDLLSSCSSSSSSSVNTSLAFSCGSFCSATDSTTFFSFFSDLLAFKSSKALAFFSSICLFRSFFLRAIPSFSRLAFLFHVFSSFFPLSKPQFPLDFKSCLECFSLFNTIESSCSRSFSVIFSSLSLSASSPIRLSSHPS